MPRLKTAGNTQQKKKCVKGFPCGYSCQPQGRKCKKLLEGQASTYQGWLTKQEIAESKELIKENPKYIAEAQKILDELNGNPSQDPPPQTSIKAEALESANKVIKTRVLRSLQTRISEDKADKSFLFWANELGKKGGYSVFKEILEILSNNPKQELSNIVPFKKLSSVEKAAVRKGVRTIKQQGKNAQIPTTLLRQLQALRPEATRIHNEAKRSSQVSASALREKEKSAFVERKKKVYRIYTLKQLRQHLSVLEVKFNPKAKKSELVDLAIKFDWNLHNDLLQQDNYMQRIRKKIHQPRPERDED